jgi:hypothetical protein
LRSTKAGEPGHRKETVFRHKSVAYFEYERLALGRLCASTAL